VITAELSAEVSMKNRSNRVNTSKKHTVSENSNKVRPDFFEESVKSVGQAQGSTRKAVQAGTRSTSGGTNRRRAQQGQRFRAGRARKNRSQQSCGKSQQSCGTSFGQSSGIQITISELETVLTVKLNLEPLTFCIKTDNNKFNKGAKPNSQGRQKSKNKNQAKPSGAKTNKTKGYRLPKSEKFLDRNQVSYTPWTELQKKKFAKLIEESLIV
jgi:hypothetical protein